MGMIGLIRLAVFFLLLFVILFVIFAIITWKMTNDIVQHKLLSYVNQAVYIRSGQDILVSRT